MSAQLKPLHGAPKRIPFLALDIEAKAGSSRTKAGFTRPFLVGVYDGESYVEFRDDHPHRGDPMRRYHSQGGCIDQAMRHVLTPENAGKNIYAHYGGKFDYLFLLPWLMLRGAYLGYEFSIVPVASSIQILDVRHGDMRWRFLDSYKLIPIKLDKAAKAFGLEGKLDHDLHRDEFDPAWSAYLRQDCEQLFGIVERFHHYIEQVLGGEVGVTAPATAMKLFRRKFLKRAVARSVDTHEFVRSGYFGGRTEVFREGGQGLRYYDLNSSYPRAMLEKMPVGEAIELEGRPPEWLLSDNYVGFVECDVIVPDDIAIPPLPVRGEKTGDESLDHLDGKLIFPTGKLTGVWEWGELYQALTMGCTIERWKHSVWYQADYLFKDFIETLYSYRDKSQPGFDEGLAAICKLMMNSSYGKFGQRSERKEIHRFDDPNMPENAVPANPTADEQLVWISTKDVDASYIIPQISARVTALARVQLLKAMLAAVENGGSVYYTDTDSVITNAELPTGPKLGELKDEYPEWSGFIRGRFLGPKLYVLTPDHDYVGKGKKCKKCGNVHDLENVRAKGFEERTVALIDKLARGETIVQNRLEKVGTLGRAGFLRGPRVVKVPKSIHLDAGKREKLPDGTTRPWHLEMWS